MEDFKAEDVYSPEFVFSCAIEESEAEFDFAIGGQISTISRKDAKRLRDWLNKALGRTE